MGMGKRWSRWTKERVGQTDDKYGAYELGSSDNGEILYIGSGKVRTRLMVHLPPGKSTLPGVSGFRVEYLGSERAARGRERTLLFEFRRRHARLPKFNNFIPPAL